MDQVPQTSYGADMTSYGMLASLSHDDDTHSGG